MHLGGREPEGRGVLLGGRFAPLLFDTGKGLMLTGFDSIARAQWARNEP